MGVAMTLWLPRRIARVAGESPSIAAALKAQGAQLSDGDDADILVHLAAPPAVKAAHELTHEEWRSALDSGLDQRFFEAKAFADACRAQGRGGVVTFVGAPEQDFGAGHAAAAGALGNLTKTLAVEWARDGIRVNTVLTRTNGETLGNLVAYLSSDYGAYVTGAVMGIDQHDA
jgi:NAD(P)-dependent dehydrogenase (short-subunit alcohol dehydrogenase family)